MLLIIKKQNTIMFNKIDKLPNFIQKGEALEDPESASTKEERYAIHARNILRHIIRGTPLCVKDGQSYDESPLAKSEIFSSLFKKQEKELMDAFRLEMQTMLKNAFIFLSTANYSRKIHNQCESFLTYILSAYPFMAPEENEKVTIPTKIEDKWEYVDYQFKKIDISPRLGPLSWLLEEEDRIYAYGLVTEHSKAPVHLLLMGTTYPGGQGSAFADLYNVKPLSSVGEGHSFTKLAKWLKDKDEVIVSGHSKGATMSMIAAAKWPSKIKKAYCFNPAALTEATLARYKQSWMALEKPPAINVLINTGDIVPYLDMGFLPGTKITRVTPIDLKPSINFSYPKLFNFLATGYEAHIHHFSGRENVDFEKIKVKDLTHRTGRHILSGIKWVANWLLFPIGYCAFIATLLSRKIGRVYQKYKFPILAMATVGTYLGGIIGLIALGIPLAILPSAILLSPLLVPISIIVLSKLMPLIGKIIQAASTAVAMIISVVLGGIGGFVYEKLKPNTEEENKDTRVGVSIASSQSKLNSIPSDSENRTEEDSPKETVNRSSTSSTINKM